MQGLVDALFATLHCTSFQQLHRYAFVFETIPYMPQLGWDGPNGDRVLDVASGMRQFQKISKVDANPVASARSLSFYSDIASADEDIGVVPVDEDAFHFETVMPFGFAVL